MRFGNHPKPASHLPFKEKVGKKQRQKIKGLHVFKKRPSNLWQYRVRNKALPIVLDIRRFLQEKSVDYGVEEVLLELAWLYSTKVMYVPRASDPAEPAIYVVAPGGLSNEKLSAVQYDRLIRRWSFEAWPQFIENLAKDPEMKNLYQIGTLKEYRR